VVQAGLVPALDRDSADVITGSEHIVKAFAANHSLTATEIVDLINNVLQNPAYIVYSRR
jgi:predicted transcriptional regulator